MKDRDSFFERIEIHLDSFQKTTQYYKSELDDVGVLDVLEDFKETYNEMYEELKKFRDKTQLKFSFENTEKAA